MGSSLSNPPAPSAEFLAAFRDRASGGGALTFAEFMELALYHPKVGYYRNNRTRVGYGQGTDFYTASTSGPVFGELVCAAATKLLGKRDLREFTFVEIGAEHGRSVIDGVAHPFGRTRTIGISEPMLLEGRCIVFSNELFDAQPFRRFVFQGNAWREIGVKLANGLLVEATFESAVPPEFPPCAQNGYVIDAPLAAVVLARKIAMQPWTGLFIAADYGKSWQELVEAMPAGTARAYHQHRQSNDLLAQPGEQDLTCHVCWDWLGNALIESGCSPPVLESQEAFFIRHAGEYIASTSTAEAARFSPKKLSLLQLLHPSHLGQKFQVLHAQRL